MLVGVGFGIGYSGGYGGGGGSGGDLWVGLEFGKGRDEGELGSG